MLCILNIGTVPTLCILNIGTVPTLCILYVGTVPTFRHSQLFYQFLKKYPHLHVINGTELCEGIITRKRIANNKTEEAVLDFFVCCEKILPLVTRMVVNDHERLARFTKEKVIESDHCTVELYLDLKHPNKKRERVEIYDFKNADSQKRFKEETSKSQVLSNLFNNKNNNFYQQVSSWYDEFQSLVKRCFRKIRLTGKTKASDLTALMNERITLKRKIKEAKEEHIEELETKLKQTEAEITNKVQDDNFKIISENIKNMTDISGKLNSNSLWKIKRKMFPTKKTKGNMAKKNKNGKLITNPSELKALYLQTYINRLRNRPILPGLENLKILKEYLCQQRLKYSGRVSSAPITRNKMDKVLKSLKRNKAGDPGGLINELFRPEIIGDNLKESLFLLLQKVKENLEVPEIMKNANITSIYKSKGAKNDLKNDRGIFGVNIFRRLLLKIIYNDEYFTIDSNMSDSNVGGRKKKNIRNHIFIVNGVMNEALKNKENLDIEILDYRQCFDGMWLDETINDLFEAGLTNNNLKLIYKLNEKNKVAVVTPHGLTDRVEMEKIVLQGENFAPLECSVQVDSYGRECLDQDKYLFKYRNTVPVPPLATIDDLLSISKCGKDSVLLNAFLNMKTNMKKLQYGEDKCVKLHIGSDKTVCPDLLIDKWKIVDAEDTVEPSESSVKDVYCGKHLVEEKRKERYLGDIIDSKGKNTSNIQNRIMKGHEKIKQIMGYLDDICFGRFHFIVAKILRETVFLNSILLNSEAWYSVDKQTIEELEKLDNILLKKIFELPTSTPAAFLHLELGTIPIRFVLMIRRLNFLQYILKEQEDSLILVAQIENTLKGDWWEAAHHDIVEIGLDMSLSEIQTMSEDSLKTS